jgi:asparagine synthetase B (glutamine-hydrolysing)
MCGITGWVDFERDLRAERETLDAMTKTMAFRGPDASGAWLAPTPRSATAGWPSSTSREAASR